MEAAPAVQQQYGAGGRPIWGVPTMLLSVLVAGCAIFRSDNYKRPAMLRKAREEHIAAYGADLPWPVSMAYVEGRVVPGMPAEMVEILYGPPDLTIPCPRQNLICDRVLVYSTNDTHVVGAASIRADTVVQASGQLAEPCRF